MNSVVIFLLVAFGCGLVAVLVRLPPLVGFLVAGFVLAGTGVEKIAAFDQIANLGVTLLLFGIGLKLDVRTLVRRDVLGAGVAHMVASIGVGIGLLWLLGQAGFPLLANASITTLLLISLALSFSSTVYVVKTLDERSDTAALYGRIAIGILVLQDIAAVAFVTSTKDRPPSLWALSLVLLIPGSWLLRRMWRFLGHGEMQALFGIVLALVPGYYLFELVGLKGDLGALLMGVLISGQAGATELSHRLFTVKELLLVGFFVTIGYHGQLTWPLVVLGLTLLLYLPVQVYGYLVLLRLAGLRHRTAARASLILGNYSEFCLIVVAIGAGAGLLSEDWVVASSVAVAASFVLSALVNRRDDVLVHLLARLLPRQKLDRVIVEDRPIDIGRADAVVLGMGRIGRGAYLQLHKEYGRQVVGIESDAQRVDHLRDQGIDVVLGDATDSEFWQRLSRARDVSLAVLAMPFHGSNVDALNRLHENGFTGQVAVVTQYDDESADARQRGADAVLQIYDGAGRALADLAVQPEDEE